jgi:hypothetical protein
MTAALAKLAEAKGLILRKSCWIDSLIKTSTKAMSFTLSASSIQLRNEETELHHFQRIQTC